MKKKYICLLNTHFHNMLSGKNFVENEKKKKNRIFFQHNIFSFTADKKEDTLQLFFFILYGNFLSMNYIFIKVYTSAL